MSDEMIEATQKIRMKKLQFTGMLTLFFALLFGLLLISPVVPVALKHFQRHDQMVSVPLILVLGAYLIVLISLANVYDTFRISISKISEMFFSGLISLLITNISFFIITSGVVGKFPKWNLTFSTLCIQTFLLLVWSFCSHKIYFRVFPAKKTLVIADSMSCFERLIIKYGLHVRYEVVARFSIEESLADLEGCLADKEAVFISSIIKPEERAFVLKYCVEHAIDVYFLPSVSDTLILSGEDLNLFHTPVLKISCDSKSYAYLLVKRILDIVFSIFALFITLPVTLVIALLIKFYDGGSVFIKQCRLTQNGKKFKLYKFRSMRMDAESDGVARLSTGKNDKRVTPIGRFIRKTRIDELPQFINVLKGDMSVVGPRPERPEIAAQYEAELAEFSLRLQVKAGITGYAQIYGKYNASPKDKLLLDLIYIAKASIAKDLEICLLYITMRRNHCSAADDTSCTAKRGPAIPRLESHINGSV